MDKKYCGIGFGKDYPEESEMLKICALRHQARVRHDITNFW